MDSPMLSPEAMAALREFALERGIPVVDGDDDPDECDSDTQPDLIELVRDHFDVKDREEVFKVDLKSSDYNEDRGKAGGGGEVVGRRIAFEVKGVKRELGQTLSSTGLTIWRAAEHLCEYIIDTPDMFEEKSVCELGAGLGMVSILLGKLNRCSCIYATDGDEDTLDLLRENVDSTGSSDRIEVEKLWWGLNLDSFAEAAERKSGLKDGRFDLLLAADVIYEEEQIDPLIKSVMRLLREDGEFILAFARRNVKIDDVLSLAEENGMVWEIISSAWRNSGEKKADTDTSSSGTDTMFAVEPIYSIRWRKFSL